MFAFFLNTSAWSASLCNDRRFADIFVLGSLALGYWAHPAWLLITAFVGFNLLQSSYTAFCQLERILDRVGFSGCARR